MPQSPNKTIISSLVETFQRNLEPSKVYDAIRKMNDDLNKTYDALFFGPLPAVDGFNLTKLNAASLVGLIPEKSIPSTVARTDRDSFFAFNQSFITGDDGKGGAIELGAGTLDSQGVNNVESWFRIKVKEENVFFISQNYDWDGSNYVQDTVAFSGSITEYQDGDIQFYKQLPADGMTYGSPYLAQTWFIHGKEFGIINYAQTDELLFASINENDVLVLGDSASTFTDLWRGHISIPNKAAVSLPTGSAGVTDGIIVIDKTNNRLCYYANGNRYRLAGILF